MPPLAYLGLKLAGEAGEVAEKIGKLYRDSGGAIDADWTGDAAKELGDVLWYVAQIATQLGLHLGSVMEANLLKLERRSARGVIHGSGDDR